MLTRRAGAGTHPAIDLNVEEKKLKGPAETNSVAWARVRVYVALSIGLVLVYVAVATSDWRGSTELHTIMEVAGTILALIVGVLALVRFYTKRSATYLLIGVGFVGTAMLDGYHSIVTSSFFNQLLPSPPASLIPWSWSAGRTFLAVLMFFSCITWRRNEAQGRAFPNSHVTRVYVSVACLTLACFGFFAFTPLPRAYYQEFLFGRPQEFVAALFLIAATAIYLRQNQWKRDPFLHWIVMSLIVGVFSQAVFMSRSYVLFDAMFDMAHGLKVLSYLFVLIGLVISSFYLFREAEHSWANLAAKTKSLEIAIAERERLESHLVHAQKMESIGQLAAGIAHEINTPIQYIGDNTRFMHESVETLMMLVNRCGEVLDTDGQKRSWPERAAYFQQTIEEVDLEFLRDEIPKAIEQTLDGVDRVAEIVRAMKDFSHPGGTEKTPTDLNKAIESTITVCRNRWKYVADLETDFQDGLPMVPCLVGEFNQVILNIVVNAADAIGGIVGDGGEGKGRITVSTRLDGEWVEIRVSDTGCGISEEIRRKVFDPFFTTKKVGKGTGQGLAISHDVIVSKHRGTIDLDSEPGVGTTFVIRLPLTEQTTERQKEAA